MDAQGHYDKRKLDIGKKCDLQLLQIRDCLSQMSYNKAGWRLTLHLSGWVDLMDSYEVKNFNFKILKRGANVQNPQTTKSYQYIYHLSSFWYFRLQRVTDPKISDHIKGRKLHFTIYNQGCCNKSNYLQKSLVKKHIIICVDHATA